MTGPEEDPWNWLQTVVIHQHRYWKSDLGHLEKQPGILIAEASLQLHEWL